MLSRLINNRDYYGKLYGRAFALVFSITTVILSVCMFYLTLRDHLIVTLAVFLVAIIWFFIRGVKTETIVYLEICLLVISAMFVCVSLLSALARLYFDWRIRLGFVDIQDLEILTLAYALVIAAFFIVLYIFSEIFKFLNIKYPGWFFKILFEVSTGVKYLLGFILFTLLVSSIGFLLTT